MKNRCSSYDDSCCPGTVSALEEAMRGESEAIKFYMGLISMAPNSMQREVLNRIRNDEMKHLNKFQAVYCRLTGKRYEVLSPTVMLPRCYRDGLQMAFKGEQETYEFYKKNYFCCGNPIIKKAYEETMLDEAEHSRWFNNLLIQTSEMKIDAEVNIDMELEQMAKKFDYLDP